MLCSKGCATPASGSAPETLTLVAPWIVATLFIASIASWIAVLVALCLLPRSSGWIAGRWVTQLALLVALFQFCRTPFARHRLVADERDAPRLGRLAVIVDLGFGGHIERLCRVRSSGCSLTTYDVLLAATNDAESDIRLIRPAKSAAAAGRRELLVGADDVVAYAKEGGWCSWIYEGRTGAGHAELDVFRPSPFALLDASTPGVAADLDAIVSAVASAAAARSKGPDREVPDEPAILAALDSPNAWIRDAAHRIVIAGGSTLYPEATTRVAAEPK